MHAPRAHTRPPRTRYQYQPSSGSLTTMSHRQQLERAAAQLHTAAADARTIATQRESRCKATHPTDPGAAPSASPEVTLGRTLASLQEEFPAFQIWWEVTGEHARFVAVRRHPGTTPHTVVTADIAELRAALSSPAHSPANP